MNPLDVKLEGDFADLTVREYLLNLLLAVWEEGEGFDGKRPFGNSGWEYDLYIPLAKAGFIEYYCDMALEIGITNKAIAHAFVSDLIIKVFNESV